MKQTTKLIEYMNNHGYDICELKDDHVEFYSAKQTDSKVFNRAVYIKDKLLAQCRYDELLF